jgi:adenosylmethionine-8-amino-7-oxononanoate aminotransferase
MWPPSTTTSSGLLLPMISPSMILAIELAKNIRSKEPYPAEERRGLRVYRHALEQGVLLRPLGNVIYFMPPYVITPQEIERMCAVACQGIRLATQD